MPANSSSFPWPSYYSDHTFFKKVMFGNHYVADLVQIDDAIYEVKRTYGDTIRIFICECYSYGATEYIETMEKLDDLNAIIIDSNWCGYTYDAKILAYSDGVGLFKITEFMYRIRREDFLEPTEEELEIYRKNGVA